MYTIFYNALIRLIVHEEQSGAELQRERFQQHLDISWDIRDLRHVSSQNRYWDEERRI